MKNILLGKTQLKVSPIGMGVLPIGPNQRDLPLEQGAEIIKYAIKKGFNFLDTAQYYRTYPYIRKALSSCPDEAVICTKSLATGYEDMKQAVEEARRALDKDAVDIFLLHEVREGDFQRRQGAWEYLNEAKSKGLVKAIGLSTHDSEVTTMASKKKELDVVFSLINYAGLGIRKGNQQGSAEEMAQAMKECHEAGKGVMAMKAFGGGNLTTSYQKALGYVLSKDFVHSLMIGFGSIEDVEDAVAYIEGKMNPDYNPDVSLKKMIAQQSDCQGCGECIKACQTGAISFGDSGLAVIDKDKCLTCGYCAPACPVRAIIMY